MLQILSFCLAIVCCNAQTYEIISSQFQLQARASVAGIEDEFDIHGTGLAGTINFTNKSFELRYDLWKLDSGVELRNEHMHENHLETEDFPIAEFNGTIVSYSDTVINVTGSFELHGVTQALSLKATRTGNQVTAQWKLNLTDYDIEIPRKFLIAKLNEVLRLSVSFELKEVK